jgi:hypothetical protein
VVMHQGAEVSASTAGQYNSTIPGWSAPLRSVVAKLRASLPALPEQDGCGHGVSSCCDFVFGVRDPGNQHWVVSCGQSFE